MENKVFLNRYKILELLYRESERSLSWKNIGLEDRERYFYRVKDYDEDRGLVYIDFITEIGEETTSYTPIYVKLTLEANFIVLKDTREEEFKRQLEAIAIDYFLLPHVRNIISNLTENSYRYTSYFIGLKAVNLMELEGVDEN